MFTLDLANPGITECYPSLPSLLFYYPQAQENIEAKVKEALI